MRRAGLSSLIFELQRSIRVLRQEIDGLAKTVAAEASVKERKNCQSAFSALVAPDSEDDESEEENARKDRRCQERRIEIDLKERRLSLQEVQLLELEKNLEEGKKAFDTLNLINAQKIKTLEARVRIRQAHDQRERERLDKIAKDLKEAQEAAKRRRAEAVRKRHADAQAREAARREDEERQQQHQHNSWSSNFDPYSTDHAAYASGCIHDCWWNRVNGPASCPECQGLQMFVLQCRGCGIQACLKCQRALCELFSP